MKIEELGVELEETCRADEHKEHRPKSVEEREEWACYRYSRERVEIKILMLMVDLTKETRKL